MKLTCEHNWALDAVHQDNASFRCTTCARVIYTVSNDITYRLAKKAQLRRKSLTRNPSQLGERLLCTLLEEAAHEIQSLRRWKEAVLGELVTCGIFNTQHTDNPVSALNAAIHWNIEVALDPKVSEAASNLIKLGRAM